MIFPRKWIKKVFFVILLGKNGSQEFLWNRWIDRLKFEVSIDTNSSLPEKN